jgi:hypothetical protein
MVGIRLNGIVKVVGKLIDTVQKIVVNELLRFRICLECFGFCRIIVFDYPLA